MFVQSIQHLKTMSVFDSEIGRGESELLFSDNCGDESRITLVSEQVSLV